MLDALWSIVQVELHVKPVVAGRTLNYPVLSSRVCRWLEARLLRSLGSSMVFPAAADLAIPWFEASPGAEGSHAVPADQQQQGQHASAYKHSSSGQFVSSGATASRLQQRMAAAAAGQPSADEETDSSAVSGDGSPVTSPVAAECAAAAEDTNSWVQQDADSQGTLPLSGSSSHPQMVATESLQAGRAASPVPSQSPVQLMSRRQQLQQLGQGNAVQGPTALQQQSATGSAAFAVSVPRKSEPWNSVVGPLAPQAPLERAGSGGLPEPHGNSFSAVDSRACSGLVHHQQHIHHLGKQCVDCYSTSSSPAHAVHSARAWSEDIRSLPVTGYEIPVLAMTDRSYEHMSRGFQRQQTPPGTEPTGPRHQQSGAGYPSSQGCEPARYGSSSPMSIDGGANCATDSGCEGRGETSFVDKLFGKHKKKSKHRKKLLQVRSCAEATDGSWY